MSKTQSLASGTTVGPYQIVRLIGVGGMGEVYEAYEPRLDRHVALKIISPELIDHHGSDEVAQRFIHEALNLAKINHPNVVIIHNADRVGHIRFIAMEYVDGVSLKDLLKKKSLGIDEVVLVFLQLLEGLRCLHEHKMIHRDMKPHNLVFRANGQLKILDFGIAKRIDDISDRTQAGVIVGSVPYMAPEIRYGQPATIKTDLWSVGAVIYEALVGEPLVKAMPAFGKEATRDSAGTVVFSKEARERIPEELRYIVKRLCVQRPEKRYATAAEVIADLKRFQAGRPHSEADAVVSLAEKLESLAPRPASRQSSATAREIRTGKARSVRRQPEDRSPSASFVVLAAVIAIAVGLWLGRQQPGAKKTAVASPPPPTPGIWLQYVSPRDGQSLWLEDKQIVTMSWVPSLPRGDYRLVLARDRGFSQIVMNETIEGVSFRPDRVLTEGAYFWKLLPQKQGLKAPAAQGFSLSYVSAPEMISPSEKQEFDLPGQAKITGIDLIWKCKFGATRYLLQVATDLGFTKDLKETRVSDCKVRESLGAATYFWRVRVEEPTSSLKTWSHPREFSLRKIETSISRLVQVAPEKKTKAARAERKKPSKKAKDFPSVMAKTAEKPTTRAPSAVVLGVPTLNSPRNRMSVRLNNSKGISVTFSWTNVPDSIGYALELSQDPDFKKIILQKALTDTNWVYRNADFSGKIYWRVRAESAEGSGDWSQISSFEVN